MLLTHQSLTKNPQSKVFNLIDSYLVFLFTIVLTYSFLPFSFAEESKQRRETEPTQEPEAKKARSHSPVIEDFTLPPFNPDNPIGKRSTRNDATISANLLVLYKTYLFDNAVNNDWNQMHYHNITTKQS